MKHYLFRNDAFERQLNLYDIVVSVPILFGVYWALPYFAIVIARPLSNAQIFASVVLFLHRSGYDDGVGRRKLLPPEALSRENARNGIEQARTCT